MKKKIDKLFHDRFHNVESPPPMDSWEYINKALSEKRKRRRLLLWFELTGAAAVLALVFTFYNLYHTPNEDIPVTILESKENTPVNLPHSNEFQKTVGDTTSALEVWKSITLNKLLKQSASKTPGTQGPDSNIAHSTNVVIDHLNPTLSDTNRVPKKPLSSVIARTMVSPVGSTTIAATPDSTETPLGNDLVAFSKYVKETHTTLKDDTPQKRLSIKTIAGAVYFDNFGKGNSLDPQYTENSSGGEFTMAYGIRIAYKLSPGLNIRSGVSKVHLSYTTNNIDFEVATLSENLNPQEINTPLLASSDAGNGHLNQSLEYIELPLEIEFSVLDKKIGLNIIGGASTFILDANKVSHSSPVSTTQLGGATNLNKISYSANLGMGLNYNFTPQFQFNLEPIIKYQINTYNTGNGLNPYIIGIYSGLTFKF